MLFAPKEKGQGLVEYAIILALVAIVVIAVMTILGKKVNNTLVQGFLYDGRLDAIAELDGAGVPFSRSIEIGIMIEVPSAPERMNGRRKCRCGSERACRPGWKTCPTAACAASAPALMCAMFITRIMGAYARLKRLKVRTSASSAR